MTVIHQEETSAKVTPQKAMLAKKRVLAKRLREKIFTRLVQ